MEYESFKTKGVIFESKYRLERKKFKFESGFSTYEFFVDAIGHNALTISGFFNYSEITKSLGIVERQLHDLISARTKDPSVLKRVAGERKFYLYNEKINVNIENHDYPFKIGGIGPFAVKLSIQITYDDIVNSNNPLEVILRNLIHNVYKDLFQKEYLIRKIQENWEKEEAHKQKIHEEVLNEEKIKEQKKKELEEFLKS